MYKQFCCSEPLCITYKAAYRCMTDLQRVPACLVQSSLPISRFDPYTVTYGVHKIWGHWNVKGPRCVLRMNTLSPIHLLVPTRYTNLK
jgi:hypothetical protein